MTDVRTEELRVTNDQAGRTQRSGGFIWYELITPDPAGSKAFYDAVVGWDIDARSTMAGNVDYRMIKRSDGGNAGGVLTLTDDMVAHGARPVWLGYVHVEDVDRTCEAVEANGGKVIMPASDVPNVGRIAMIGEPSGAPIYVMKPIPPEGRPDAQSDVWSADAEQRVAWNELGSSDPGRAREFFRTIFGWRTDEFLDMGENGKYWFIDHGGNRLGAMFKASGDDTPGWRFYIRVPSIAAAVDRVKEGGGIIQMAPHEVPGGDHIIIGTDPQGARFALVGKA